MAHTLWRHLDLVPSHPSPPTVCNRLDHLPEPVFLVTKMGCLDLPQKVALRIKTTCNAWEIVDLKQMGSLPLEESMIKRKTGEMREEIEVTGRMKGNPKSLNFVLILQEIKSTPWCRSFFHFPDIEL